MFTDPKKFADLTMGNTELHKRLIHINFLYIINTHPQLGLQSLSCTHGFICFSFLLCFFTSRLRMENKAENPSKIASHAETEESVKKEEKVLCRCNNRLFSYICSKTCQGMIV